MTLAFPSRSASLSADADKLLKSAAPAKLDWKPVDVNSLPREYASLYAAYKDAQAKASIAREAFEDAICGDLAKMLSAKPGQDVAFGYRFGQLSVALTEKRTPRAASNALRF